jgi:hypothetical protein
MLSASTAHLNNKASGTNNDVEKQLTEDVAAVPIEARKTLGAGVRVTARGVSILLMFADGPPNRRFCNYFVYAVTQPHGMAGCYHKQRIRSQLLLRSGIWISRDGPVGTVRRQRLCLYSVQCFWSVRLINCVHRELT